MSDSSPALTCFLHLCSDPIKMPYLELECPGTSSCTFDKADVVFLNNENLENFLENTVRLDEVVSVDSLLEMENAEVRSDVTPERINGHRSAMLLDGITESLLDAELVVNGTVVLHSELKVNGLVDGVRFNQSQMLLVQGHQLLTGLSQVLFRGQTVPDHDDVSLSVAGVLSVDTVTIRDLELEGKLDGVRVEDLQKPREVDVNPSETSFDRLNVHDLHVLGTLSGVNLSHIMSQAVRRDYGTSGGSSASLAGKSVAIKVKPSILELLQCCYQLSPFTSCCRRRGESNFTTRIYAVLKLTKVVPLFKKGERSDSANHRPISILPAISMVFEKAMANRLGNFFESLYLLTDS